MALPLAGFLLGMMAPLVKKVLTALGVGIISYAALTTVFNQLESYINGAIGGISGDIYAICSIFGLFQSTSIILSAISVKLSMTSLKRFGILP